MSAAPVRAQTQVEATYRLEQSVVLRSGWRIETHRRFVAGAPVIGALRRVRTSPAGEVETFSHGGVSGSFASSAAAAMVSADAAIQRVAAHARRDRGLRARRVGFVHGGRIVVGWEVSVDAVHPSERLRALVDGRDGRVVATFPTASRALGRIYDPDPVGAMGRTIDVELENLASSDRLNGTRVRSVSCDPAGPECSLVQAAVADAGGDFLFDPEEPSFDDAFAEVNAYVHADRAAGYFDTVHGLAWDCCGRTQPLDVVVNYAPVPGEAYGFSVYAPSECDMRCGAIFVGQGEARDLAYDGDVLYHEHAHAIVDERAQNLGYVADELGLSYEPGAVKEGTADYFTAAIGGDPIIAEYLSGLGTRPRMIGLRSLDNTARCPDDLFGESHEDGQIWGGALWSIRQAVGAAAADELVMVTALSSSEQPTFVEASEVLMATARTMAAEGRLEAGDVATIEAELAARGLPDCRRIVTLDDGTPREGFSGRFFPTSSFGSVAPVHYRLSVPVDASRVRVSLADTREVAELKLLVRVGAPVTVSSDGEIVADQELTPTDGGVVLDAESTPALPPGDTLYFAVVTENLENESTTYTISASIELGEEPEGCRCGASGVAPGADIGWVAAALFVGRRRSKR